MKVVFTCRADFYGHVLGYRPLVDCIREGAHVPLGPMDGREIAQVVEAPAKKMRLEFEPGLPARILRDVGEGQGRLPLLSFLLEQLWKQRRGSILTNEAYDAMGGVERAIATVAEDVFTKLPEPDQQRLSRLFIQLVSVGEESEDTRRRAAMMTLGDDGPPLVARLATARLLVTSSDQAAETVEIAHEALIRHWDRSKAWVNGARGFLSWRKRLEPFLDEWRKLDRDRTALLRGGLLAEAQRWLADRRQDLDAPEREFIEASLRQQEADRQAERRKARILKTVAAAAIAAACLATGLGAFAWKKQDDAKRSAQVAFEKGKLASKNEALAKKNAIDAKQSAQAAFERELASKNEALARKNAVNALRNLSASLAAQGDRGPGGLFAEKRLVRPRRP